MRDAESNQNADHLKYMVIMSRRPLPLSREQVIQLVDEELAKVEDKAGKRWFLLVSVKAFERARFHQDTSVYRAIFDKTDDLAKHPEVMNRVLRDFVVLVSRPARDRAFISTAEAESVLKKVFPVWLTLKQTSPIEADLGKIAANYDLKALCEAEIQKVPAEFKKTFLFKRRLALYYASADAAKALPYLEEAEKCKEFAELPELVRRQFYESAVAVCKRQKDLKRAVEYQQKCVQTAGGSKYALANLYRDAKDLPKRDAVLGEIIAKPTNPEEFFAVLNILRDIEQEAKIPAALEGFLQKYEACDQYRLQAISRLIEHYRKVGKAEDADRLIQSVDPANYPKTPYCADLLRQIKGDGKAGQK